MAAAQPSPFLPRVTVTARQARALAAGHPWVPPEGLAEGRRGLAPGACIALVDGQGRLLGTALACPGETPAARLWSREGEPVTAQAVLGRAAAAWRRRSPVREGGATDACRLIHGEADGLPGLFADAWGPWVTVELHARCWEPWLDGVLRSLERLQDAKGVGVRRRFEGDAEGRLDWVRGKAPPAEVEVRELGLRYKVRLSDLKTGLFPDERENRAWLAPQCAGKAVLNAFAFTGAFSVTAAAAGAREVTSLDLSAPVLKRLQANLKLNGLDPACHPCVQGEVLATLRDWAGEGRRFDVVILDPPAYATHAKGRWRAEKDYPALVARAAAVLAPGGLLAAALTVQEVSPERFETLVREALRKAGRAVATLQMRGPPADFPVLRGFPEGGYLKFVGVRVR